ncbi:MAG: exodeoxyribonuclease III [Rhodobacteraceae bacterium]|nr:exodeoxyribonuclease III [Paracoccaceae bacterium]
MKIASFNINGIRARLACVLRWLEECQPETVLLQEIKCTDGNFPRGVFEELGYQVETHGQKSFNGVAILSKFPLEFVTRGLPGDASDVQARWIEAVISAPTPIRVCCLYLPNGNPAPGPKFEYKLAWMERLHRRAAELIALEEPALLAGDFNVIPQSEDAETPEEWVTDALFRHETRQRWRQLLHVGFTDALRAINRQPSTYTFWDFQRGAWERNDGIRIDHFLLTPQCADLLMECGIDQHIRGWEKPSDHVPIWVTLRD